MKGLASLLLVLVVGTHYGYDLAASFYANPDSAARSIFYIFRGVEGTVLYCIVWALAPMRPVHLRLAVSVVCAWGAIESAQTSICRLAVGITNKPTTGLYRGLCDVVTGWPIYMGTLLLVLLIFAFQYTKR